MYQGIPRQDAGDGTVLDVQAFDGTESVPAVRMGCLRMGDELGNHVNPDRVDAERPKVAGDMARPAPQIEHVAGPTRQMSPDEGEVIGMYLLAPAEQFDVEAGHGGVRVPNLLHVH